MIVATSPLERGSRPRVLVPTMGALHEGHRALMRQAREVVGPDGEVVVSIFVNPTQFGQGEDFDDYPRNLDADVAVCEIEGADVVYAPSVGTVYGDGGERDRVMIDPGALGSILEGAQRPGHFSGVLTVVSILFQHVAPQVAVFGEKDYQQLELIKRMCADLSLGVEIVGAPTVRDHDGLALSSRNIYLSVEDRRRASAISRALEAAKVAAVSGSAAAEEAALAELSASNVEADYVTVRAPDLGGAPPTGAARLLIAARVGPTRLIDNCALEIGAEDRG